MKVSIIYNSKYGTTKAYAEAIGEHIKAAGMESKVSSITDYDKAYLQASDLVLLGCWTDGLFLFAQHPDKAWKKFATDIPEIKGKKLGLFTTYKLATGSMFRKMEACIAGKADEAAAIIKSKTSALTEENKKQLDAFLQ